MDVPVLSSDQQHLRTILYLCLVKAISYLGVFNLRQVWLSVNVLESESEDVKWKAVGRFGGKGASLLEFSASVPIFNPKVFSVLQTLSIQIGRWPMECSGKIW